MTGESGSEIGITQEQETAREQTAETYFMDLGLDWEALKGKTILDIGAGQAKFAQAAKKRGIAVTSVDIEPGGFGHNGQKPVDVPYIIGDFREGLELPAESFDIITARASLYSMVETQEDLEAVLREAKRLLKPEGEFRFGPGNIGVRAVRQHEWDKWHELLEKVRNNEDLTAEEDAWGEKVWPQYEQELSEDKALEGLSEKERKKKIDEFSLARLQKIDPNFTAHPYIREIYWKGKLEREPDVYYVMRKESSPQEG